MKLSLALAILLLAFNAGFFAGAFWHSMLSAPREERLPPFHQWRWAVRKVTR